MSNQQENEYKQIEGLRIHAYTPEGKNERLEAQLKVRIRPNNMARLQLLTQSFDYGYPLIDQIVDDALHDYLIGLGR